jgi:hypothetical protein
VVERNTRPRDGVVERAARVAEAMFLGSEFAEVLGSHGDIFIVELEDNTAAWLVVRGCAKLERGMSRGQGASARRHAYMQLHGWPATLIWSECPSTG